MKFTLPKKKDVDTIGEGIIVTEVQLIPLSEKETEFVFLEDDDLVYFDKKLFFSLKIYKRRAVR